MDTRPPSTASTQQTPSTSEPTETLTCIIHPTTGQLMAPGSKVWPYFIDDPPYRRHYWGPRGVLPEEHEKPSPRPLSLPETISSSVSVTEADAKMENNVNTKKKRKYEKKMKADTKKDDADKDATMDAVKVPSTKKAPPVITNQAKARPANNEQIAVSSSMTATPSTRSNTREPQSQANIDFRYAELVDRNTYLRLKGRTDESHIIQAAMNVGVMLGWTKIEVLDVVARLEQVVLTEKSQRHHSSKMMEVIGEIERFRTDEWSNWEDLKQLRENFKGRFYDGVGQVEEKGAGTKLRAPGFLMLLQAAVNVSFLRGLDLAIEDGEEFHDGVFDGKAVLFFRVPNGACIEEKDYLMQMSRLGTVKRAGRKVAACPGIERPIKEDERRSVLEKVRDQVEGGREIIRLATILFGRSSMPADGIGEGESLTNFAMKYLDDEGVLVLDYVYRKSVGFPILLGDVIDIDEEEEEDEELDELSRMSMQEEQTDPEQSYNDDTTLVDFQKLSLVVILKYRSNRLQRNI